MYAQRGEGVREAQGEVEGAGPWLREHCGVRMRSALTCDSRLMDVVSPWMDLAMPKSMSFSWPCTSRKLAGFKSECTMRSSWMPPTACGGGHG